MAKRWLPQPIKTFSARSSCFASGVCWGTENPYWCGCYETEAEAVAAAERIKPERDKMMSMRVVRSTFA